MGMPSQEAERRFRHLLEKASHCVIATASPEGDPEAAVLAFAPGPDLSLYVYTLDDSRKYQNLQRNTKGAMVLYEAPEYAQLDGHLEELHGEAAERAREHMLKRASGDREDYHSDPRCRYFLFHPNRISLRVDHGYPAKYETWNPEAGTAPKTREL